MPVVFKIPYVLSMFSPIPTTKNLILSSPDINECNIDSPCHANATCNNTEGSYTCECIIGFTGNGFTCDGMLMFIRFAMFSLNFLSRLESVIEKMLFLNGTVLQARPFQKLSLMHRSSGRYSETIKKPL